VGCPVPDETPVRVWFADEWTKVGVADEFLWMSEEYPNDAVVAYEVLAPLDQWEYRVVPMPKYARYPDCSNVLEILTEAGADGWELAAAPEQYAHFIFKRRKA
jgi:hypothetical protein